MYAYNNMLLNKQLLKTLLFTF